MRKKSQIRVKRVSAVKTEKSSYKNRPWARRLDKKSTARRDAKFITKLDKTFALTLRERFVSISVRRSAIKLLGLEVSEKRKLPHVTKTE